MKYRSRLIYLIWLNSLWRTHCCSLLSSLTHSKRNWEPETDWRPVNTKPTRGQCLPGQHACLSEGQHWPMRLTLGAEAFDEQHRAWGKLEGVGMFLWVSSSAGTWEEKDDNWCVQASLCSFFFSAGGMCLPALGCLMETQAGSVVSLVGPWVRVTTWCQFRGSFTLKSGPIEPATSTTGVSHTTGAYANIQNH